MISTTDPKNRPVNKGWRDRADVRKREAIRNYSKSTSNKYSVVSSMVKGKF